MIERVEYSKAPNYNSLFPFQRKANRTNFSFTYSWKYYFIQDSLIINNYRYTFYSIKIINIHFRTNVSVTSSKLKSAPSLEELEREQWKRNQQIHLFILENLPYFLESLVLLLDHLFTTLNGNFWTVVRGALQCLLSYS